jgi:hypothetical protein
MGGREEGPFFPGNGKVWNSDNKSIDVLEERKRSASMSEMKYDNGKCCLKQGTTMRNWELGRNFERPAKKRT